MENKIVAYNISRSFTECSQVVNAINHNCKCDNEDLIPIKIFMDSLGIWSIECLNQKDNARLEKRLQELYED